jgi:hypothetical protein
MKLEFSRQNLKGIPILNFTKVRLGGAKLFYGDGQTDG